MTAHPSKFSDSVLAAIRKLIQPDWLILDPFAGVGRIHELSPNTIGNEIEMEWASAHKRTVVGDALALPFVDDTFDAIVTSPTYSNRMADHHDAKDASKRHTYRHTLGRELHPHNSGQLQWGKAYQEFHVAAWTEAVRCLQPEGTFLLNISDHVRKQQVVPVAEWHADTLQKLGLQPVLSYPIQTKRMRHGANPKVRVDCEWLIQFRKDKV